MAGDGRRRAGRPPLASFDPWAPLEHARRAFPGGATASLRVVRPSSPCSVSPGSGLAPPRPPRSPPFPAPISRPSLPGERRGGGCRPKYRAGSRRGDPRQQPRLRGPAPPRPAAAPAALPFLAERESRCPPAHGGCQGHEAKADYSSGVPLTGSERGRAVWQDTSRNAFGQNPGALHFQAASPRLR